MIILDIVMCIIILLFGFTLKDKFLSLNEYEHRLLHKLFFYHILFGIVYYLYVIYIGGDAYHYWTAPKNMSFNELWEQVLDVGRPSEIMFLLNYIPSNILNLSFFTGSLIYSVVGYWSFIYFLLILKRVVPYYLYLTKIKIWNISIFPLLLFLPNLHFWSSGVGKDTLLFFTTMLFIYSLINVKKRVFGLVISFLISFFIRPHITLFLIVGFGLGYALDNNLKVYQKVFISLVFGIGFIFIFNSVLSFIKLDSFNSESIGEFSKSKATALSVAGSGMDISSYPYPLKVFTFLYRPLFFDIHNAIAVVASFENLLLLLVTFKFLKNKPIKMIKRGNWLIKSSFFFFILGALSFSLILSNLGIMLREKNMFMLTFYIFIFWSFHSALIIPYLIKRNHGNQNIN